MKKRLKLAVFLTTLLTALSSCEFSFGGNSNSTSKDNSSTSSKTSNSIDLTPNGIAISESIIDLNVGETYTLTANILPLGAEGKISWRSENESIVTVNDGLITAINVGTTDVFASFGDFESNCKVTVKENNHSSTGEVHLYAMNDFHGSTVEQSVTYGKEYGILKNGSFFKSKGQEDNTLILNSGDMWQGSIESNSNYGEFLTKAMNNIQFDCFTLGNHEFDWGGEYIASNKQLRDSTTGYQTPFLAANIYKYDINKKKVLEHADELGQEYVIRNLENGLRVGIIGVIGSDQITSISSQFADSYTFIDPTTVVKELSDELRNEKKCDVIVVDAHASIEQVGYDITNISPNTNKKYADAVFCAHSHQYEKESYNGVPYVQASCNGKAYAEIHLSVNNGVVSVKSYNNYGNDLKYINNIDAELKTLYEFYKSTTDEIGNEILGTINDTMSSATSDEPSLPKLVTKAMAKEALSQGFKIDYAICNQARADLTSGQITYAELAKSLPFNNELYILKVPGDKLIYQCSRYNSFYRVSNEEPSRNKTYTIVVIDYLAFHRNKNREYDYFAGFEYVDKLAKEGSPFYTYRDVVADYFREYKAIDTSKFTSSSDTRFTLTPSKKDGNVNESPAYKK